MNTDLEKCRCCFKAEKRVKFRSLFDQSKEIFNPQLLNIFYRSSYIIPL